MKFLLYGLNYSPELTGIGRYTGEMGSWLASAGHDTAVVCAPPYYPQWQVGEGYSSRGFRRETVENVSVLRCPLYVPSTVTTVKRLLHLFSFALTSFFGLWASVFRQRPQLLVVVIPTLFCLPGALLVARLLGIKCVLHIQDYELEAMLGLGMGGRKKNGELGLPARTVVKIKRWLLRRCDAVSTISYSMMELAVKKGVEPSRLLFFPNWVDTGFITPAADRHFYRERWGFDVSDRVVLYSGNLGRKQGLEIIVEAAQALHAEPNIRFVVVGDGAYRQELMALVTQRELRNVMFQPLQPYEQLPQLMALADVHLVVQRRGAADAVLPSKLTSILSAGGYAVITADPPTELGRLCAKHPGIAQLVEPESASALVVGIRDALAQRDRQGSCNTIARAYAEHYLNRDAILREVEQQWCAIVGSVEPGLGQIVDGD